MKPSSPHAAAAGVDAATAIARTRHWLQRAVIGLNLCPFAKAPHVKGQIHYAVHEGGGSDGLLDALRAELLALAAADAAVRETTLLIAPNALADFLDFNDFLDDADAVLQGLDLAGTLQIAPFHPHFQFAGTAADDITNATNQSPYPTLHLLREQSIDRAVAAFPQAEDIYGVNMATMRRLGREGWERLLAQPDEQPNEQPNEPPHGLAHGLPHGSPEQADPAVSHAPPATGG